MNEKTKYSDLADQLSLLGGEALIKVLSNFEHYRKNAIEQNPQEMSRAKLIKHEFGELKFSQLSASDI